MSYVFSPYKATHSINPLFYFYILLHNNNSFKFLFFSLGIIYYHKLLLSLVLQFHLFANEDNLHLLWCILFQLKIYVLGTFYHNNIFVYMLYFQILIQYFLIFSNDWNSLSSLLILKISSSTKSNTGLNKAKKMSLSPSSQ